jgi:CheY-like chemotaxis protein
MAGSVMAQILLVDDDIQIRRLLENILATEGHRVQSAGDGAEALHMVHETAFDMMVTDLVMPEKEGLEIIREVRREFPLIKIIAMTGGGYGSPSEYLALARAFGVEKTLLKPFSRDDIITAVSQVLATG